MQKEPAFKPWVENLFFGISVVIMIAAGWFFNDLWFGRIG